MMREGGLQGALGQNASREWACAEARERMKTCDDNGGIRGCDGEVHSAVNRGMRGTISITHTVSDDRQPSVLRECYAK